MYFDETDYSDLDSTEVTMGLNIQNFKDICKFWSKQKPIDNVFEDNNELTYTTSDIHGDLNALLNILIMSGFAYFPQGEPLIVEVELSDESLMEIPNLSVNTNFRGKLVILGDLIDRGRYSLECFELVKRLIEKSKKADNSSGRLVYLFGNHEMDVITYSLSISKINGWRGTDVDFYRMQNDLILMLKNGDIKLIENLENNLFASHVVFEKCEIHEIFDFLKIQSENNQFFKALYDKYGFLNKIIDSKLTEEQAKQLSLFLNELTCTIFKKISKNKLDKSLCNDIFDILLFNRTLDKNCNSIKGFAQIVGHDPILGHSPVVKPNCLYIDCYQSEGYNNGISYPTFLTYKNCRFKTFSLFTSRDLSLNEHRMIKKCVIPSMFSEYIIHKLDNGEILSEDDIKDINDSKMILLPEIFHNINIFKKLAETDLIDLNVRNQNNNSVFTLAFNEKKDDICKIILNSPKFNPNIPEGNKHNFNTILHMLVVSGEVELAKILLNNQATEITSLDVNCYTPLMLALDYEDKGFVELFLSKEKVDDFAKELRYIIENKRYDLLELLYEELNKIKNEFYYSEPLQQKPSMSRSLSCDDFKPRSRTNITNCQYRDDTNVASEIKKQKIKKVLKFTDIIKEKIDQIKEEKEGIPIDVW